MWNYSCGYAVGEDPHVCEHSYATLVFSNGDVVYQMFEQMSGVMDISWKRDRYLTKIAFNIPYTGNYDLANYVELRELFLWGGPVLNDKIIDTAAYSMTGQMLYSAGYDDPFYTFYTEKQLPELDLNYIIL